MSGPSIVVPDAARTGAGGRPATFGDAVRSEWTKFRTLRSLVLTVLVTVAFGVGFAALISHGQGQEYAGMAPEDQAAFDPTATSLSSYLVAQLAAGVLGTLVVTSEYATGMIWSSLVAVPRRWRLLAAKALVLAGVALVMGQLAGWGAFLVGQPVLAGAGAPHAALGDPEVLRAVIGAGLYLAAVGLVGVALGVLVRATAGAISILVSATLLVPAFSPTLPEWVARVWPSLAGPEIMSVVPDPATPGPWAGFATLWVWVAVLLAAAFVVFRRRDA